jgi:hypothetical protein
MPTSSLHIREVLDEAVRSLAVSSSPLQKRLESAGSILLRGLSRESLVFSEDRELFDQICAALGAHAGLGAQDPVGQSVAAMSDAMREWVAGAILDLRDTMMGRAIHDARATPKRELRWRIGRPGTHGPAANG